MELDALARFYEELTPASLDRLPEFYTGDAFFKDPFNEVRGVQALRRIFTHMFKRVVEPRFVIIERMTAGNSAMLVWEFRYGKERCIRGASHLHFADDGRVTYHRDYWDAAEELYMKLPVLGSVMRGLRRAFAARQPTHRSEK